MSPEFIKLTGGDPDVEAPQHVIDVALDAIKEGEQVDPIRGDGDS